MDEDIIYIVCIPEKPQFTKTPESVIRQCSECNCNVWCQPFNMDKTPICLGCFNKVENPDIRLDIGNLKRAIEFLKGE